jgi:hypothetical protein
MIIVAFALLILVASTLPIATVVGCPPPVIESWCKLLGPKIVDVTILSLAYVFPLAGIVIVGAVVSLLTPGLSLFARSYGRAVRGLTYLLVGVFSIIAIVTYHVFYREYTPEMSVSSLLGTTKYVPVWIAVQYPFYLILLCASIFIAVGVLEWLRRPAFLFRPYSPPPPKPPKPKRMPVPEIEVPPMPYTPQPQVGVPEAPPLQPEVPKPEVPIQPLAPVGRPLGITLLAVYYILSAVGAIVYLMGLMFTAWIMGSLLTELATLGIPTPVPDIGPFWAAGVLGLILPAIMAYGLLKGKWWAHTAVRILSLLAIVGTLLGMVVGLLMVSPVLSLAGAYGSVMSGFVGLAYAAIAFSCLLGILLPAAIYRYMGRPHVKAYFTTGNSGSID